LFYFRLWTDYLEVLLTHSKTRELFGKEQLYCCGFVGIVIWVCNTLSCRLRYVIPYRRHSEDSISISFFCDVPETKFVAPAQILIRSNFILIGFSLYALAYIPFIGFHSDPEYSIDWKLFLSQIHSLSKFVIFFIKKVMKIALDEYSFRDVFTMSFWRKYLFDLVVDRIFLYFAETKVSGVNRPVIWSRFLFSWIIVLV